MNRETICSTPDHPSPNTQLLEMLQQRYEAFERYAKRFETNDIPAADIVQEASSDLLQQTGFRFQGPGQCVCYIQRAIRNAATKLYRKRFGRDTPTSDPRKAAPAATEDDYCGEASQTPEQGILLTEECESVRQAMDELDDTSRAIVVKRFYEEPQPTYAEIGEPLGLTMQQCRNRCLDALEEIRQRMSHQVYRKGHRHGD